MSVTMDISPSNMRLASSCETMSSECEKKSCCTDPLTSPHSHSGEDSYGDGYDSDFSQAPSGGKNGDKESRKNAEKQRRTVLNNLISQISTLLPVVATSTKKVDKTSILRLAANFLRIDHVFGDTLKERQHNISSSGATSLIGLMGGFLITTTVKGVITVVSPNVVSYLGYSQIDLLGHNILNITHPEDVDAVKENLSLTEQSTNNRITQQEEHGRYFLGNHSPVDCPRERRDFLVRFAKAGSRSEPLQYVLCKVDGTFRKADRAGLSEGRFIRRQRVRKDRVVTSSGNDYTFIGMVRVLGRPIISDRLLEASKQEYWTRHLIDGHIVHCDQRISLVAGYMSEEVVGASAFRYMHKEDVRWVIIALRQMYDGTKLYGESCYRLVSKTGQFIYLRTKGFLEIDRTTRAAQSFVCINSVVSDDDGKKLIADMKRKYSAIIDLDELDYNLQSLMGGEDCTEDPVLLEHVIMHLITNLPSPGGANSRKRHYSQGAIAEDGGSSVTELVEPPIFIPPPQSAIKSALVNPGIHSTVSAKRIKTYHDLDSNECKVVPYESFLSTTTTDKDYG